MLHALLPCDFTLVDQQFRWLPLCVATMSSLALLQVEILRSRGNMGTMMWGWLRVEMPEASNYLWCLQPLTNWEWLPGELLSGSECSKA